YTDSEVYIEAMTDGGNKKDGVLAAGKSVLEQIGEEVPAISTYHRALPDRVLSLNTHDQFEDHEISVRAIYAKHYDPHTIGFRISSESMTIAYLPDTEYTDELIDGISKAQLLILSVLRPGGEKFRSHLCIDEAIELARKARPEKVLLTHFGTKMISAPPENEARRFENLTGIKTIAARDSMILNLSADPSDDKKGLDLYS
ncbi:MAG: MBL fold metallo-hydrolase, partial [Nitrososphaerales archaeon]